MGEVMMYKGAAVTCGEGVVAWDKGAVTEGRGGEAAG